MFLNFQTDFPRQLVYISRASKSYWFCHQNTSRIRPQTMCSTKHHPNTSCYYLFPGLLQQSSSLFPCVVILAHCLSVSSPHSVESDRFKFRVNCHSSAQKFPRVSHLTISKTTWSYRVSQCLKSVSSLTLSPLFLCFPTILASLLVLNPLSHASILGSLLMFCLQKNCFFSQSNTFSFFRILLILYCTWKSFS